MWNKKNFDHLKLEAEINRFWFISWLCYWYRIHSVRLRELAKTAIGKKTGARGLRSIIEALLLKTMFKLPAMENVEEVVIDQSVVKNNTEPLIIHGKVKKTSAA